MRYLEENFISIVLVLNNNQDIVIDKISGIENLMVDKFKNFEIIVVDNASQDKTKEFVFNMKQSMTVIELVRHHTVQHALTAGISLAIGDYIVEIPDISIDFDYSLIYDLYKQSQKGYDFVFATPKESPLLSKIFYRVINKYFAKSYTSTINTSVVTISSRRGQNKASEVGQRIVNRNISYILTGLLCDIIPLDVKYRNHRNFLENVSLMIDTFIYHTDYITKFASIISILFFVFSIFGIGYGLISYFVKATVSGWMSTFVFSGIAFSGIFLMFSILSRYMSHILSNSSNVKSYIYRSITKKEGK